MKQLTLALLFALAWSLQAQRSDFKAINLDNADRIAASLKGEALNNLPLLAHRLTNGLKTDVERFRAIYHWVCHNIKNDYDLMLINERKRRKLRDRPTERDHWNSTFSKTVFETLLKDKRTLCTGYAYLIKELCKLAGLECEIINGFGKTSSSFKTMKIPNHSWNAVKLNGKWYLSDATWSSGYIDETYRFRFEYDDSYFLMAPEDFAKSHIPLDSMWFLYPHHP